MKIGRLDTGGELPLVVEPATPDAAALEALLGWVERERTWIEQQLRTHGGLLLRGFAVADAQAFRRLCAALGDELQRYVGGDSPRTAVTDGVYTSTEYPSHFEIPLHNEMSYARSWPSHVFFYCARPPKAGGETPLCDQRRVLAALDPAIVERFERRGVRYVRNLRGGWGFGKTWQDTFETSDRAAVERHCHTADIEFRWKQDDLWLSEVRPGVIEHPRTGERVWFNQANLWHVSALGPEREQKMRKMFAEDDLPQHAFYGDGQPIEATDLAAVRAVQRALQVAFPWRERDIVVLDNVLVAHGRRPFEGPRSILAAMA